MKKRHWMEWVGIAIGTLYAGFLLLITILGASADVTEEFSEIPLVYLTLFISMTGAVTAWFKRDLGAYLLIIGGTLHFFFSMTIGGLPFIIAGALILLSKGMKANDAE